MRTFPLIAVLVLALSASAQNYKDLQELDRAEIRTRKLAMVLGNMEMTPEQQEVFMPLYDAYTVEMKTHWDKRIALIDEYFDEHGHMTEKKALDMLKRLDALEKESLSIRGAYEQRMLKVLPAAMVLRWVQLERRFSQMIEAEIAGTTPLAPVNEQ